MNNKKELGIKRSVRSLSVYRDENLRSVYLHLLLCANTANEPWQGDTVHRGETVTSAQCIASELGLEKEKVAYALTVLEARGLISRRNIASWGIFTINDIEKYAQL